MSSLSAPALRQRACEWVRQGRRAMLITVMDSKGSTPRDAGTRMLVSTDQLLGTIGGGHLEWQAIDLARQALRECGEQAAATWERSFALGPTLGQCCGGVVSLRFAPLNEAAMRDWPLSQGLHIELHGAGHVGQAMVKLLADLDFSVRWIDTRDSSDPGCGLPDDATLQALPAQITWLPSDCPEAEVADAPAGAIHLVLTHRHDLDLRIIEAVLRRGDSLFAGLIGSQTKRAKFLHRLQDKGLSADQLAHMSCPIGLPGLQGKEPAVIAVAVVAQLLLLRQQHVAATATSAPSESDAK
ncbi:xanthine dehydrogenase accessory protein XdhC [Aquabacterium sp. NJ1]|uniref:xanthine dehydrogenase accessory protein XdhC n=1 Tax=Aquabacterium sp. NJ1 TaxID=1538295 RepID=UPI0009DD44A7|nr:xanthine dehydrogenase accessory protein XdhC [Aquabacterium sp. NJ1]